MRRPYIVNIGAFPWIIGILYRGERLIFGSNLWAYKNSYTEDCSLFWYERVLAILEQYHISSNNNILQTTYSVSRCLSKSDSHWHIFFIHWRFATRMLLLIHSKPSMDNNYRCQLYCVVIFHRNGAYLLYLALLVHVWAQRLVHSLFLSHNPLGRQLWHDQRIRRRANCLTCSPRHEAHSS